MDAILCESHKKGVIKETWANVSNLEAHIGVNGRGDLSQKIKIVKGDSDTAYKELVAEIKSNYHLPKDLTTVPIHKFDRWTPLEVFRYPVFLPSYNLQYYRTLKLRQKASLRNRARKMCLRVNGPIVLYQGTEIIGYTVSSKRAYLDGDFVISYQDGYVVMTHDPKRAAKYRKNPHGLLDHIHRTGTFRASELRHLVNSLESEIQCFSKFNRTVRWINFAPLHPPTHVNACDRILALVDTIVWLYRRPKYRENEYFRKFLVFSKVVFKAMRKRGIKATTRSMGRLHAFLRHEIRIAVRRGKMV